MRTEHCARFEKGQARQHQESEAASSSLELDRQRQATAKRQEGVRNLLSEVRLSAERLAELHRNTSDSAMPVAAAETFVRGRLQSPDGLSSSQLDSLLSHQETLGRPHRPERPDWVKAVCQHRSHFQGSVFLVMRGNGSGNAYLFLYAMQNPKEIGFIEVQEVPFTPDTSSQGLPRLDGQPLTGGTQFQLKRPLRFVDASVTYFPVGGEIEVIPDTWFSNDLELVALRPSSPLADMLQDLPEIKGEKPHKDKGTGSKKLKVGQLPDYLLQNHPWLGEFLHKGVRKHEQGGPQVQKEATKKGASSTAPASSTQSVRPDLTAEEEDATWEALQRLRNQWRDQIEPQAEHFVLSLRGGVWTQQHRGTEADCVSVSARRGVVWSWCERYNLPKMARFTLQYSTPIANALASEWSKRMQHFFDIYLRANDADFMYSEEDLQSYILTAEWQETVNSLQDRKALARAHGINGILPVNPCP